MMNNLETVTEAIEKAFAVDYVPARRTMSSDEIRNLARLCSQAFDSRVHEGVIERIVRYVNHMERHMKGRASGDIEDLVLRYLVRYFSSLDATGSPDECHLEIGVLFGATTILTRHAVQLAGKDIPNIVIDPFAGYYDKELDPDSKQRPDEATFRENMRTFRVPDESLKVITGLSSDPGVVESCKNRRCLSLFIDGDHSYTGLKKDWQNYAPLVPPGRLVLIDDYNALAWPDVARFVNGEVLANARGQWEFVLVYGSSIILRRTSISEAVSSEREDMLFDRLKDAEHEVARLNSKLDALSALMDLLEDYKRIPWSRPIFKLQTLFRLISLQAKKKN